MKISSIDIRHRQFKRGLFGLDEAEVIEFLQHVAQEMESLVHEKNQLRDAVREKDISLLENRDRDKMLQSTIQTAASMSEKIRQDAEREAKLIIADAHQKAEFITRDSRDSLKKVYQEVSDLKRSRLQFEASLKGLMQAHLTLLEQGDKILPNLGLLQDFEAQNRNDNQGRNAELSPLATRS